MITLGRARLALVCASVFAIGTLVFELPIGVLFHQRSQLTALSAELSSINGSNAAIRSEITSLGQGATIAAIAHADYGLVKKGQRPYVVLPAASPTAGQATTLDQQPIPASDLIPVDPALLGQSTTAKATSAPSGSILGRTAQRLEFWRWAF